MPSFRPFFRPPGRGPSFNWFLPLLPVNACTEENTWIEPNDITERIERDERNERYERNER